MRERDYIHATDLRTIRIIKDAMRHLLPGTEPSDLIQESEYRAVMQQLREWEDRLEQVVITT